MAARRRWGPTWWAAKLVLASLGLAVALAPAGAVGAQDAAHGRLLGDLEVDLGAGGGATFDGRSGGTGGAVVGEVRVRYLDMVGPAVGVEGWLGGRSRVLLFADFRPLFLLRFFFNASFERRWADILLDSIGLDLGAAITPLDGGAGAALMVGVGLDVPVAFFGEGADGLFVRLSGRHVAARARDRYGPDGGQQDWAALALLVVRLQASTGLSSWEPPRYRVR
ncbi:MAG: hypothetical protein ACFCGT_19750 [Sandaracinaceae bacterium]